MAKSEDKNEQNFKKHLHKAFLLWYTLTVNVTQYQTKVFAKKVTIVERVGFIDLGSNTARLVIIDILDGGYYSNFKRIVEDVKEIMNNGKMD